MASLMNRYRQVLILALAYLFAFAALPLVMLVGSLIGAVIAPDARWATLPIALMICGTAVGVIPAARIMRRLGRKLALVLYSLGGAGACVLAAYSISVSGFVLFCVSTALLGVAMSAMQQIRFAAIETVALDNAGSAASLVMCGGIVAALVGPELAEIGRHLTAVEYQGAFLLAAAGLLCCGIVVLFYTPARPVSTGVQHGGRPLSALLANPAFVLAVSASVVGYVVMSFVMTGTPLSMQHHGHSFTDTKWVLQSHMVAMFAPSLVAPWLFGRFGIRPIMVVGLLCYLFSAIYGYFSGSVMAFLWQLVALGMGWNFLFVGGTALLAGAYQEAEQFKAQAFHDFIVFSMQSLAALSAGWAVNALSWSWVMVLTLVPVLVLTMLLLWESRVVVPGAVPLPSSKRRD